MRGRDRRGERACEIRSGYMHCGRRGGAAGGGRERQAGETWIDGGGRGRAAEEKQRNSEIVSTQKKGQGVVAK